MILNLSSLQHNGDAYRDLHRTRTSLLATSNLDSCNASDRLDFRTATIMSTSTESSAPRGARRLPVFTALVEEPLSVRPTSLEPRSLFVTANSSQIRLLYRGCSFLQGLVAYPLALFLTLLSFPRTCGRFITEALTSRTSLQQPLSPAMSPVTSNFRCPSPPKLRSRTKCGSCPASSRLRS